MEEVGNGDNVTVMEQHSNIIPFSL